jgi:hypothetical protein
VRQENRKILFSAAAKAWQTITQGNRDSWDTWAAANPQYAKNNPASVLSGFAVFTKWHSLNFLRENDISDVLVAPTQGIQGLDTPTILVVNSTGTLTIDTTWATGDDELYALYFISRPFNASQNFVGTTPKFVDYQSNADDSSDITATYTAQFGAVPAVGDIVNVNCRLIGQGNGQVFGNQAFRITVTAP